MSQRQINPLLKIALDIGPVAVYFAAYQYFQDRPVTIGGETYGAIVAATAVFMPAILASLVVGWAVSRELPRMAVFTALMVLVFGGLTIWLNDDTFAKMRPTVVYGLFALVLGGGLWLQGRSYLAYLMGGVLPLTDEGWRVFTRNWVWFFAAMSIMNEIVWRTMSEEVWIWLDTWGQFLLSVGFLMSQMPVLRRYAPEEG